MRNFADRIALIVGCVAVATSALGRAAGSSQDFIVLTNSAPSASFKQPTNLDQLLALPATNLDKVDVGLINLLCAEGLRGSEHLDIEKNNALLDAIAARVASETQRYMYRFKEDPMLFLNSLGYFRMQMLGDVLVNDLRMRYDPVRVEQSKKGVNSPAEEGAFFNDSKDIFIHGLLDGNHSGTCASMPFLYVAVGRRLGYPVNLAATEEHLYVRYEEPDGQHINIEATAVSRFKTPPDEYYREQLTAVNRDAEIKGGGWLRPLSNGEILGHSLLSRLACLQSAKRDDEALKTWDIAARYLPQTARWAETVQARKMAVAAHRDFEKLNALWMEVAKYPLPEGEAFVHFREQKIQLHLLMSGGASLATIEKAVGDFEKVVAKSMQPLVETGAAAPITLNEPGPQPGVPVANFSFQATGKEVTVPLNLLPPMTARGMPKYVSDAVGRLALDSREAIVNFVWDCFEHDILAQERADKAAQETDPVLEAIMLSRSQFIFVPREQVPEKYWNGVPQNLKLLLDGLSDPRQIIGTISAYDSAEKSRKESEQNAATIISNNQARLRPPGVRQPAPNPYEEQNRRLRAQAEADREARECANSLREMRIRFVPGTQVNSLQGMPGIPVIPFQQTQQFPQGLQQPH